ncbi:hypothetical protein M1O16_05270 [Dehalococcoidia bacterium]|nr:hypothetical protein [Dehalococcoidia bacterium]
MPRRGMKPDLNGYRERWKVERTFAWLFNFRRLIVRWEHDYHIFLLSLSLLASLSFWGQFRDDF